MLGVMDFTAVALEAAAMVSRIAYFLRCFTGGLFDNSYQTGIEIYQPSDCERLLDKVENC